MYKFKLNFDFLNKKILSNYFKHNLYKNLNDDFKSIILSPKFLICHINLLMKIILIYKFKIKNAFN